jgi:phenylacetate-coenzyme A ligase PaaK-like adenylate-forming protein
MIEEVPLYAGRQAPPASEDPAALSAWLASMPVVQKRDLRRGFPKSLVRKQFDLKQEMARGAVDVVAISGTADERLQVFWDRAWWSSQERDARCVNARVRAALAEDREKFRELILTTPIGNGATCHTGSSPPEERTIDGALFLNQVADPAHWSRTELDRMVTEWNDFAPHGIKANPAYLAKLCRHARERGQKMHSPNFVTLTYGLPTRAQRRDIGRVLDAPMYLLFSANEVGALFFECEQGRLHPNSRHLHIELEPLEGELCRMVVTTLGRTWMPLLRYAMSEVVRLSDRHASPCSCSLDPAPFTLVRVEGRSSDCLDRRCGLLTPAMIDDAIEEVDTTLSDWELVAEGDEFRLHVVGSDGRAAATRLAALLSANVEVRVESALLPESSGRIRVVRT